MQRKHSIFINVMAAFLMKSASGKKSIDNFFNFLLNNLYVLKILEF